MKYLNLIQDHDDISSVKKEWVNVIRCLNDDHVHYMTPDLRLMQPLTFEITSSGNINWLTSNSAQTKTIQYKLNDGEWIEMTSTTEGTKISVVNGDVIQFIGNNISYADYENDIFNCFGGTTCRFNIKGNIMSLINSTNYANLTSFPKNSEGNFYDLFQGCTGLTDASELILPATTLGVWCYSYMFEGCTSLTTAPELPATTLATNCYSSMFYGCTSLTTAPELPATTLESYCYESMFEGCTSLVNAPVLPATTLAEWCYSYMFNGCTSLVNAPVLPATTLATYCYNGMFSNCTSLVNAPELPANILTEGCYNWMFANCTSLVNAPELPAKTLVNYCYNGMFRGCASLTQAPVLPATTLAGSCYYQMFSGCTNLNYIKCLATNISASNCTTNWVNNVASTGMFIKDKSMTSWTTGANGIPSGWTVQDPEILK